MASRRGESTHDGGTVAGGGDGGPGERLADRLLGDLSLGLTGSTVAGWSYQVLGLAADAGVIGAIVAAGLGGVALVLAERRLRYYLGT